LARARQRAVVHGDIDSSCQVPQTHERETTRSGRYEDGPYYDEDATTKGGLILFGVVLLAIGVWTLWRASHPDGNDATDNPGRCRRRWIVGGLLTAGGVVSVVIAVWE